MVTHMFTSNKKNTGSKCEKSFDRLDDLKMNMEIHSGGYSCVQCNRSFNRADNLKQHLLTDSGAKSHTCSECEKSFGRAET